MPIVNAPEKFTANGDVEAEKLLGNVLLEIREALSGTDLCVVLGGSYARGEGGVRAEREKGLLFNDLDLFVFAEKKVPDGEKILKALAEKYHKILHIDVDFSRIMPPSVLRKDGRRLMMQELKRNYVLVAGKDLIAEYLPELPAEKIPFEEAFRLLLNRGMGLFFAAEKMAENSDDGDFILRNIYKAVLGAGDAILIRNHRYCWKIAERSAVINSLDIAEEWKALYQQAVCYKRTPHGHLTAGTAELHRKAVAFLKGAVFACAGTADVNDLPSALYEKCRENGETSWTNLVRYCIKSRSAVFSLRYSAPAVTIVLADLMKILTQEGVPPACKERLFKLWRLFN